MGSPRRFANQGLVYLSEIKTKEEIQDLSVKQAKDILAMNRVNFKGVVEKDELLKHVLRLWKQDNKAQEGTITHTVWKFQNFSTTLISREITFCASRSYVNCRFNSF